MDFTPVIQRFEQRQAVVGVVGLGYVGLPLALTFACKGVQTVGLDIDVAKITMLEAGKSYIEHIDAGAIKEAMAGERLRVSSNFATVKDCDALLMCVPTPLNKNREPDMQYIEGTARGIAPHMRPGQLVVLESTTYPGTTDELLRTELEEGSGLQAGEDFLLAYSPEREDPGNPDFNTQRIPKVVGGLTAASRDAAVAMYGSVLDRVVPVSSTAVAEMTKLLENIFRSVNIALVNELKVVCQRMGIDVWEVIAAASTKPFGFMPFYPGPGLGGHCIPIDPFYLTWKAREYELSTRFIELAGEVNTAMPRYVVERTAEALNEHKKPLRDSAVLVLGVAYKRDVDDMRESPAMRIIELLQERGANVTYHDPYVPELPHMRHHSLQLASTPLSDAALQQSDAVVIVTDHSRIDYGRVVQLAPLVVDTRNATAAVAGPLSNVFKA